MPCPNSDRCPMVRPYGAPEFNPSEAIEGDPASPIWIVALNPKTKPADHTQGRPNPMTWGQSDLGGAYVPHFGRLKAIVGDEWHRHLLRPNGIAHTDLLKCGSPAFTQVERQSVEFCRGFLLEQIKKYRPKLLLVLSSDAARYIETAAQIDPHGTEGLWNIDDTGSPCYVLLSGYSASQQERYARRRLRRDFLAACTRLGLHPPDSST